LLIGGAIGRATGGHFLDPLVAEALGTVVGAASPYVSSGVRTTLRNPLLGTVGGVAGAETPSTGLSMPDLPPQPTEPRPARGR